MIMNPEKVNTDCIFCKIASREIPSNIVYQDEDVVVFPDINPVTPVHMLIIPVKHITTVSDAAEADAALLGKMVLVANKVAKEQGLDENGYRLIINCKEYAGQVIWHLHMHLMGGRQLRWNN